MPRRSAVWRTNVTDPRDARFTELLEKPGELTDAEWLELDSLCIQLDREEAFADMRLADLEKSMGNLH